MVLVDTSVWVSHFKNTQPKLIELLNQDLVSCHPLVIAEIACGTPPNPRARTLGDLSLLNQCKIATQEEVLSTIERYNLFGRGCGYIDIALLASALITDSTKLWTLDKRLNLLAKQFDRSFLVE
ncbi:MAG: putative nucleic acid-binding protein [Paraglaciecola sp.]|jgi:predicted nucleic acid-binding protein